MEKNNLVYIKATFIPFFLFLTACQTLIPDQIPSDNLASQVNPFIGTGGHGHTYPGASTPFGFVQLSPDSRLDGWDGCGGYHYSDSVIYGFSHTHLSGTGVSDYGDVLLMPMNQISFKNGYEMPADSGYGSRFTHEREKAEAGFYKVHLLDYDVEVRLTATDRCGFHRYQFPKNTAKKIVLLDLQHRDKLLECKIEVLNDSTIRGKRISKAWAQEQHIYFHLKFNKGFIGLSYNADSTKVAFEFKEDVILIKTGLSAVSEEGAAENLKLEIPHWDFEKTKRETQDRWHAELSKIRVQLPNDSDYVIFYTALYHSYLNPNIFQDVHKRYRGTDLEVHKNFGTYTNYTVFSLWDTYRATHPLFTITQRERTEDFIKTFLNHYQNGGKLPVWELAGNYTGCMIGYHSVPVIVDAYFKGIDNFDKKLALEAMIATANADELGKREFATKGYAAMDEEHESVSKNLEYAYDDWCIAQFAKAVGNDSIYKVFIQRAQHYKNNFDPSTHFMRAKRNQQFATPFDPTEVNFNYTEANAWQYSFYVPQDIEGLIGMHGGKASFESKLDEMFNSKPNTSGRHQVDITGLMGQYAHGNEPSHHMAYLYNYVDKPSKTQEKVRALIDEMYTSQADGLIGNEDCGQMSSWYVLSALGFYPVCPGDNSYIIGSPKVESAEIRLENGKVFAIQTLHQSEINRYIQKVELNGEDYRKSYLLHDTIMNGGKLTFYMGNQPKDGWFKEGPKSAIEEHQITALPYIEAKNQVFEDSLEIEIKHYDQEVQLFYSLNAGNFKPYETPLVMDSSVDIRIKALSQKTKKESPIGAAAFYKINRNRKVSYNSIYHPQYTAGGDLGLVDLIRGGQDFRTGAWQGFQGEDLVVTVELERAEKLSYLSAGFLQDINSWIWMPTEIEFLYSTDGVEFTSIKKLTHTVPQNEYGVFVRELSTEFNSINAKYIQLKAKQFGRIPDWHLGKGGQSFIFIDELIIH